MNEYTNTTFLSSLSLPTSSIDEELLLQSLTHKSYAMDYADGVVKFNERLEFLGDSILWAVIARLLYDQFSDVQESQLTLSKIFLVKEKTLADVARKIWLGDVMRLGAWEARSWGSDKDSVLSDWLEAFIAYVYLQYWRSEVESFIKKHIYSVLGDQPRMPAKSWKNQLQELVQKYHNELPIYKDIELEIDSSGDVKLFGADIYVLGEYVCQWTWTNKKKAQEDGAMKAMETLRIVSEKIVKK